MKNNFNHYASELFIADNSSDDRMWIYKYRYSFLLITLFAIIVACRFISVFYLQEVFFDEETIIAHINSIIATGHDTFGTRLPLFPAVGPGSTTYTYLYPMVLIFSVLGGCTALKARLVQEILTILACIFTSFGVKIHTKDNKLFWITLFVSSTLPWGFVQAARVWDPSFVPVYFSVHFLFFMLLLSNDKTNTFRHYIYAVLSFGTLVFFATVYPPARIPAVAMWIFCLIWAIKEKKIQTKHIVVIFIVSSITALPLAISMLDPAFNSRSAGLFIFNQEGTWYHKIHRLFKNFASLLGPAYLFVSGDISPAHSLPVFGVLGTLSVVPLVSILRKQKLDTLTKYMLYSILFTFISVSLTYDYQPHTLRACPAWMPFAVIITLGWKEFLAKRSKLQNFIWFILFVLFFALYFAVYILYFKGTISMYIQ